jgi:hypothetical protein
MTRTRRNRCRERSERCHSCDCDACSAERCDQAGAARPRGRRHRPRALYRRIRQVGREQLQKIRPDTQKQFHIQTCRAFDGIVLAGGASYQMEEELRPSMTTSCAQRGRRCSRGCRTRAERCVQRLGPGLPCWIMASHPPPFGMRHRRYTGPPRAVQAAWAVDPLIHGRLWLRSANRSMAVCVGEHNAGGSQAEVAEIGAPHRGYSTNTEV